MARTAFIWVAYYVSTNGLRVWTVSICESMCHLFGEAQNSKNIAKQLQKC